MNPTDQKPIPLEPIKTPTMEERRSSEADRKPRTPSLDILQKIDKMIQEPAQTAGKPSEPAGSGSDPIDKKTKLFKEIFKGEILP